MCAVSGKGVGKDKRPSDKVVKNAFFLIILFFFGCIILYPVTAVNVGLEIPNFVGIILLTPLNPIVNSLSNIRKPLFYRFMLVHP